MGRCWVGWVELGCCSKMIQATGKRQDTLGPVYFGVSVGRPQIGPSVTGDGTTNRYLQVGTYLGMQVVQLSRGATKATEGWPVVVIQSNTSSINMHLQEEEKKKKWRSTLG